MKKLIITLCTILLLFNSCNDNENNIDKTTIIVSCDVYPSMHNQTGPTGYSAYCQIGNREYMDFSDAIVCINNVNLPVSFNSYSSNTTFYNNSIGTYNTGDIIELTVSDSRLGYIKIQGTIPISPNDFNLSPDLPMVGIDNTSGTYLMTWLQVDQVDKYIAGIVYTSEYYTGYHEYSDHHIFNNNDLTDENGEVYKKIGFSLCSLNESAIPGYESMFSKLYIAGCNSILKNN